LREPRRRLGAIAPMRKASTTTTARHLTGADDIGPRHSPGAAARRFELYAGRGWRLFPQYSAAAYAHAELNGKFKLRATELTFAPDGYIGVHHHVGPGIRFVISGELTFAEGGQETVYKAGEYFGLFTATVLSAIAMTISAQGLRRRCRPGMHRSCRRPAPAPSPNWSRRRPARSRRRCRERGDSRAPPRRPPPARQDRGCPCGRQYLRSAICATRSKGGTFRGKPRRNGRACGRQYLRSATCATRSKGPRGPTVGYGPHRTIYLAGQTGIKANGRVARASARRRFRALS
jgi:quercetin dioxygenase-like cupin family protein